MDMNTKEWDKDRESEERKENRIIWVIYALWFILALAFYVTVIYLLSK